MIEMPPLKFANTNGIRMGYYEAGPADGRIPMLLCHGWPELAFSWRHQIKALGEAGIRVIAPDQRGYGATDRPENVEDYDLEHLTTDLVGLLDHLGVERAVFVGHDWGGFVVWGMPMHHPKRVAGVVGVNTPHLPRSPIDPIELFRKRFGDSMYIVQFQDPAREPDRIFGSKVEQTFDMFMRRPGPRPAIPAPAGVASHENKPSTLNLAFPQFVQAYDAKTDPREPILSAEEKKVFVETFTRTGFTGGINWYRNLDRNWALTRESATRKIEIPAAFIVGERDPVLGFIPPDPMGEWVPGLREHVVVPGAGHWIQQQAPAETSEFLGRFLAGVVPAR